MKIDIETIRQLAENIEKYKLEEVTVEVDGTKVTLKKEAIVQMREAIPQVEQASIKSVTKKAKVAEVVEEDKYEAITSPMVGTYYASPAPGSPVFISEGTEVKAGDTLCIVEAMKLMNEVKASRSGKIVKILLKDGEGVKKGDKLFLID